MVTNIQDSLLFADFKESLLKWKATGMAEGISEAQMQIVRNVLIVIDVVWVLMRL